VFLPDMMVDLPVRPATWFTADPEVERAVIPYDGGSISADVYRPGEDGQFPALIFSMGAPPLDRDDERLIKLAEDMARLGIVVIVPFSERLDEEQLTPEEVDALVGVFQWAEEQPYVDPERIGYLGVSVGGSMALLAAADERIAERVDLVISFGAYLDALDVVAAIGPEAVEYEGERESWEPDRHTIEVIALQLIATLEDENDKRVLCKAFVDRWDYELCDSGITSEALSQTEIASLTTEGRVAYELLTSEDLEEARVLVEQLPPASLERLRGISPAGKLDALEAEVFIIHDRGDKFIAYVESRRLRDMLEGRDDIHFTEVSLFEHVEPRLGRGGDIIVIDGARLYFRMYQLLKELS
jgi:acetyl esterase/lipase